MGVAVTAGRHHEPLASIVYNLGLTCLNKGFDAILVAYIHVLAVFYRKGFDNLIVLGSEDLTIDHKVGTGLCIRHVSSDTLRHVDLDVVIEERVVVTMATFGSEECFIDLGGFLRHRLAFGVCYDYTTGGTHLRIGA